MMLRPMHKIAALLRRFWLLLLIGISPFSFDGAFAQTRYEWIAEPLEPKMREPLKRLLDQTWFLHGDPSLPKARMLKMRNAPYVFAYFGEDYYCVHVAGCLTMIVRFEEERAFAEFIIYSDGLVGFSDTAIEIRGQQEFIVDIVTMRRATRIIRTPAGWMVLLTDGFVPANLPRHPDESVSASPPARNEVQQPIPPMSHDDFKRRLEKLR